MANANDNVAAKPPFRADHVGSLLRPAELAEARAKAKAGQITAAQLREVEDRCIRHVVALQEAAGLQSVTDGELRRTFWHVDFLTAIEGIAWTHATYAIGFQGKGGERADTSSMLVVDKKIKRTKPIMRPDFEFLKSVTSRTAKVCIPSPTLMHMRGGRKVVPTAIYAEMDQFWADLAAAYRQEISDLGAAGCTYLQLDDVAFSTLCDPDVQEQVRRDGEDPEVLPDLYVHAVNSLVALRPLGMSITMHTCRGNHRSMWMAQGSYDAVAEALFGHADVDGFFLEYDDSRSGGFEPLRYMSPTKRVVLGLVSTKTPVLESKDLLKRRIDEAARYVPLERLCLSPQCGFASTHEGNRLTEEEQKRKLALVVEVADEVWG